MDHSFLPPAQDHDFERFCVGLLRAHWPDSDPQLWSRSGQRQDGVDIIDMSAAEPLRAAQCKWKGRGKVITAGEIQEEVERARGFDLDGLRVGRYFILTTSLHDTDAQGRVVTLNHAHRKLGLFRIELLAWPAIEEILRNHPGLYEQLVGPIGLHALAKIEAIGREVVLRVEQTIGDHQAGRAPTDEFDRRLDAAKAELDVHDWQAALLLLKGLHDNHWSDLSPRQRFLTLTYLGNVAYGDGDWQEAATKFLDAHQHLPDDERAKTNVAMAFELLDQRDEAYQKARELTLEYPQSVRPWAVVCRSAPDSESASQLESELPPQARVDDEVLAALATRAAHGGDWAASERYALAADRPESKWAAPSLLAAEARAQQVREVAYKPEEGPLQPMKEGEAAAIIGLFDRAVLLAERTDNRYLLLAALLQRGRFKTDLDDLGGASTDYEKALRRSPNDAEVLANYGKHLLVCGKTPAAISFLRQAVALDPSSDARFPLALSLQRSTEPSDQAERRSLCRQVAKDPRDTFRFQALLMGLEDLDQASALDEADLFVADVEDAGIERAAVLAAQSFLAFKRRDHSGSRAELALASEALAGTTSLACRRFVASIASRVGDHAVALDLWLAVARRSREAPDVWKLVSTASRLGRYEVICQVAEEWRRSGVHDRELFIAELSVLERYAPKRAVELIRAELEKRPNDAELLLQQSILGLRLGRPELVCRDVTRYPPPNVVRVRESSLVAQVLAEVGETNSALVYAYDVLRRHPRDADAQIAFSGLMLRYSKTIHDNLGPSEEVSIGSAVAYQSKADATPHWIVIEEHAGQNGFDDELPPTNALVQDILGKRLDEEFILQGHDVDGIKARIVGLISKYEYRNARILAEWPIRFPDRHWVRHFHVEGAGEPDQVPDLTGIIRQTHEHKRKVEGLLDFFRKNPLPVNALAESLGRPYADTFWHVACEDGTEVRCSSGDPEDVHAAAAQVQAATHAVLDLSAIVTLRLLGLEERISDWPVRLVVASATMMQLQAAHDELVRHSEGHIVATDSGIGIGFLQTDPRAVERERDSLSRLMDVLKSHADVEDCPELAQVPPKERQQLEELLGDHGAQSAMLAVRPGHVLWCDDGIMAGLAQRELGARHVWTQIMLVHAEASGALNNQELREASARLLGFQYTGVWFDASVLLTACRLADWQTNARPLKQALAQLALPDKANERLLVATMFFRLVLSETVLLPAHELVAVAILNQVASGPLDRDGVLAIRRALPALFRFDVASERRAERIVAEWLDRSS